MASQARYKGPRVAKPRVANTYVAFDESYQYVFPENVNPKSIELFYVEPHSSMNGIKSFEPKFRANVFVNNSPMATAAFNRYDEFRIRCVQVKIVSQVTNPVNFPRTDLWLWWTPNHYEEDEDSKIGETYDDVVSIEEGSRIQYMGMEPGATKILRCVPQITMIDQNIIVGGPVVDQHGDRPAPWLRTTATNRDDVEFRMPIFYFRRPFLGALPEQSGEISFQIIMNAVVEYRNLDDDN